MKQSLGMLRWFCFIFISLVSSLTYAMSRDLVERTPVPVQVTVANEYWVETISICNNTANAIPLTDMELDFNYAVTMPTNIWGQPWAAWRVASQNGNAVVLLGGAPWTMPADPTCQNPLTIKFNASPTTPAPTGPFVFKVANNNPPPPNVGQMTVTLQNAPAAGLSNPQVTVQGQGASLQQVVTWGGTWQVNNLTPGSYSVTGSSVSDSTGTYQATPLTVNVLANQNAQATLQYTKNNPPPPPTTQMGNGTWVYDRTYTADGQRGPNQPGLFTKQLIQYNNQAQAGHKLTQIFSYGGDMEMYCEGSSGTSTSTPCNASTLQVYYVKESTTAYYNAMKSAGQQVELIPIVDGVVGGEYLKTFNNLSQSLANIYADNVARLYCADDNIAGVQFDLEPFDMSKPGQLYFFTQIAKNFAGKHDGPNQPDPFGCVNANHPNGRTFSVFTFSGRVNAAVGQVFNQYGNGLVIDSLYDLSSNPGGVVSSVSTFTTAVNNEVTRMMDKAKTFNVKYQFGIPAAASVHEFENIDGQNTGYLQIDYVKAAINAINSKNARQDTLFKGINLWGWNQRMFWGGKEFKPSTPNTAVQNYLGGVL